jgi:integration host factor subunit alpha
MTITKADLSDRIYASTDLSRARSSELVNGILEIMKNSLERGEDILISGFGKFCVKKKAERNGRNPQTGETLKLGPRRVVTFTCSGVLKKKINGKRQASSPR